VEQHDQSAVPPQIDASNPERLYQAAYDDFLRANYDLALAGFRRFLEVFPSHPLADNALYWIGECYFSRGEYAAAIREFEEVARRFPDSDRLATTLLRQAGANVELGERSRARDLLASVISRFPNSDEAVLAQQQLRNLGN
jgi:tol-pal system protein YbgF